MAVDREGIFAALFARLQAALAGQVVTFSRVLAAPEDLSAAQQPAVWLIKGREVPTTNLDRPPTWKLEAELIVSCKPTGDPTTSPDVQLNQLLTAIEGALERSPTEPVVPGAPFPANRPGGWGTTLGGRVLYCWIAGPVVVAQGAIGDQSLAVVPLELMAVAT